MPADVLVNKAGIIERCIQRAREEYRKNPATFANDFTRQDAALLNLQRACEASLDMGQFVIRQERLGVPQSSRDIFALLEKAGWIHSQLASSLQKMVGFRNIAIHEYQRLQLPIAVEIIERHLDDFLEFSRILLQKSSA